MHPKSDRHSKFRVIGLVTRARGNRLLDRQSITRSRSYTIKFDTHLPRKIHRLHALIRLVPIRLKEKKKKTTYQVKALFHFRRSFTSGACYGCGRAIGFDSIRRFFGLVMRSGGSRMVVSSVSVELNADLPHLS